MNGGHKITSLHRDRAAIIYLRQSSMAQVRDHTESTRSQYGLADTAAGLGWARGDIEVIDTDLGISGKWGVARAGFTELVARVCGGDVGAIFGIILAGPLWYDALFGQPLPTDLSEIKGLLLTLLIAAVKGVLRAFAWLPSLIFHVGIHKMSFVDWLFGGGGW